MKDKLKEYFPFVTWAGIASLIWIISEYRSESRHVQFDTPTDKHKTKIHINQALSEDVLYQTYRELDSLAEAEKSNARHAIESREERDSILKEAEELSKRTAVTVFQMKEKQDSLLNAVIEYIKIHDQ